MINGLIKKIVLTAAAFSLLMLISGCCWNWGCCKKDECAREERPAAMHQEGMPAQEQPMAEPMEENMEMEVK
jgi:hypothetical protein